MPDLTPSRTTERSGPDAQPSDTLILFGATGDLAHRKIFPGLYHVVERGSLDDPVIGVARAGRTNASQGARRQQRAAARKACPTSTLPLDASLGQPSRLSS